MKNAYYSVTHVRDDLRIVWIVDECNSVAGHKSVTNDAEFVCWRVNSCYPGYRIIYQDTDGRWDELAHGRGKFLTFVPGGPHMDPGKFR